jgi:hypothetical protein
VAGVGLEGNMVTPKITGSTLVHLKDPDDTEQVNRAITDLAAQINTLSSGLSSTITGLISSGSNSNGSYVQFADGTMICRNVYSISVPGISANSWWTCGNQLWPVNFIAKPTVSIHHEMDATAFVVIEKVMPGATLWYAQWIPIGGASTAYTDNVHVIAIGKWK